MRRIVENSSLLFFFTFFILLSRQVLSGNIVDSKPQDPYTDFVEHWEEKADTGQTFLTLSLLAQKDLLGTEIDPQPYLALLDEWAAQLSRKIAKTNNPQEIAAEINIMLFRELHFAVDLSKLWEVQTESLLFHRVIETRRGNCLSLSLLYLALGQRLNLPLQAVLAPGHVYLRYDDGQTRFNIETTTRGTISPVPAEIKEPPASPKDKVITKKELVSIFLSELGNQYKIKGQYKTSIELFKLALSIRSQDPWAITNLGNVYERSGRILDAIAQYHKAIHLAPDLCEAHYNLGLAHFLYTHDYREAKNNGDKALALGCRMHPQFRHFLATYK